MSPKPKPNFASSASAPASKPSNSGPITNSIRTSPASTASRIAGSSAPV